MPAPAGKFEAVLVLPRVLADVLGAGRLRVRAATLREALEEAYRRSPALRHHLCEESGAFRPHVLCFLGETNSRDLGTLDVPLRDGVEITILQAVSGGGAARPAVATGPGDDSSGLPLPGVRRPA
ncbi:MAG: MoaD/ThiS family protein [Planctomycetales bacterium]|nr:MoaD/ThiS family protein [Planctomycetales bacterium]